MGLLDISRNRQRICNAAKPYESLVVVFFVHSSISNSFRLCWALYCSLEACAIRLEVCCLQWLEFHILHATLSTTLAQGKGEARGKTCTTRVRLLESLKHVSLCQKLTQLPEHPDSRSEEQVANSFDSTAERAAGPQHEAGATLSRGMTGCIAYRRGATERARGPSPS